MQIEDIVREGKVTAVNNDKRIAKVWFDALEIESDWMPVLINQDVIHYYPYDAPQWTEFETEWKGSRAGDPDYVDHKHKLVIKPYMPKVNDLVLVLYFPVFNGDGVILGGVKPWKQKWGPRASPAQAGCVGRGGAREQAQFSATAGNGA